MPELKTIIWFLKRPKYYSQAIQILKRKRYKEKENTRVEATLWCSKNCVSQEEALKLLTGKSSSPSLSSIFPDVIRLAQENSDKSPVKMGGEGAITLIYHLVKSSNPQNLLETGVAYGWSSLAILLAIQTDKDAHLISNDMPYVNENNEDYVGIVVPSELRKQWDLQRAADITGIPTALKKFGYKLDFCHYDSDKSYSGRKWATPILWNAISSGSYLMVDDINDNIAFKEFCEELTITPVIIEHGGKYVGILKK